MKVLGICGLKRSGKDSSAEILTGLRWDRFGPELECAEFTQPVAFADVLRDVLKTIFGFSGEQMYGSLKEVKDDYWGVSYREAAQKIGTDLMRNQWSWNQNSDSTLDLLNYASPTNYLYRTQDLSPAGTLFILDPQVGLLTTAKKASIF